MGLFYANLTVYRPPRVALLETLHRLRRTAFLGPTVHGHTVVFDRANDAQDADDIERLGCEVTGGLSCSALAAVLHDDDVLYLWLFRDGRVWDRYDSLPGYFDREAEPGPPSGGSGRLLCAAFGRPDRHEQVERLLRANLLDGDLPELPGELGRHRAIAGELGMPPFVAGLGYAAIAGGYVPEEFQGTVFDAVHQLWK
jgi:hypothetical protein